MPVKVGDVGALFRYPVKSMAGERVDAADLGWHGLDGDRRLAFRRLDDRSGFPWVTASRLPELIRWEPRRGANAVTSDLPTHVRLPDGTDIDLFSEELAAEVSRRCGSPVEMVHLNRGIFDEASVSLISEATVQELGRLSAQPADVRRFRPNILIASMPASPFAEDDWVGGVLTFGDAPDAPAIGITYRDERCAMVNLEPESAQPTPDVLKAIVRARDNRAGVYATVLRRGRIRVGQSISFHPGEGPANPRT